MSTKNIPLRDRRCVPCEGGDPPLDDPSTNLLLAELSGWEIGLGSDKGGKGKTHKQLSKTFRFDDFLAAMAFVDRMAALAEEEAHHPDFAIHYSQVDVTLWTHAVAGLSENDFILASKIDAILT
jgi:4a-hydroxytetrahydrobiopterin dehydratase